ncbi:GntR family transcriptional regulator [Aneurinibacillus aneurinilyticus]|uniref:FCD domain protein n=1 Tax=Aneurinibacillus aneurinilyticus ATCC 12856 TaxID=649747 RepID=U1X8U9_ANEAE|nr:GntR family transcriptional regulator [Aneurinibacillus aneurinilyticus]ERI11390.1 FCD domain protein [Aneurinibacillus aneurinilyticus ATCC 12856]MED0708812.1 GntR family transcriptional regulator [Aneurinibacillus aneurinilyticus]MED0722864.1 GntR family transcriptional regulator [Aneurinibacillus aneurinilyticus]MED0742879.1 GntR family transcriptional regulator [Aneurinibacillus aneurinilyticus]
MDNIVKSEPLHLQAYNIIKSSILEGDFQPGERLVESKLASKFGVSRGPIREAIRMLTQDGLLLQDEGFVQVFQPTAQDIIDIFQCRQGLEAIAVRLAAQFISADEQKQLLEYIHQTKEAYIQNKVKELGLLDQKFHDLIIEGSRNKQLLQLMEVIKSKIIYIRNNIIPSEDIYYIPDHHERIYQAILEKDEEKAEREIITHIQKGLESILKVISYDDNERKTQF